MGMTARIADESAHGANQSEVVVGQVPRGATMSDAENKLIDRLCSIITEQLDEQIQWHRKHGSDANRDRLITLAEKHVAEVLAHRLEKAEAEGVEAPIIVGLKFMQQLLPICVQTMRASARGRT
jgi:hypothetical protein